MNAQDRKQVAELVSKLEDLKTEFEEIGGAIRDLADAEQEKFDNLSEGLQQGEKGQAIEQAANYLSEAADAAESGELQSAIDALSSVE